MTREFLRWQWRGAFLNYLIVGLCCILVINGCGCNIGRDGQTVIKADFVVRVKDPDIRRLTDITENVEIGATGAFEPGTFIVNNSLVSIPPDTKFRLLLNMPIRDPSVISTHEATGTLSTTQQISVNAFPIPKVIELRKGSVAGQMNLARTVAAFFLNLVQVGSVSGDMKDMLQHMRIEQLVLKLRPNSVLKLGQKSVRLAENSKVRLTNAVIDENLNYVGRCHLELNFGRGCKWLGEKVDCEFDGGQIDSEFVARKSNDRLELTLPEKPVKSKPVVLRNCVVRFGKDRRSSTVSEVCSGIVREFKWQSIKGEEHPTMKLVSALDFTGSQLRLKTDIHQTTGYFPSQVSGKLDIEILKDRRDTHFETLANARAQSGEIVIEKKNTKLVLSLGETVVGPSTFDKEGDLNFSLEGGVAQLRRLDWRSSESKFAMNCGAGSTLTVPDEMLLAKPETASKTQLRLPIKLKVGSATLKTSSRTNKLTDLRGDILIHVADEIQLNSDLDFAIENLTILGGYAAKVKARGLDLAVHNGSTKVSLKQCSIVVPDQPLKDAIRQRIPSYFEIELNKTLKEDKKWRYRNAVAKSVQVRRLKIDQMRATGSGTLGFTAGGDVTVDGTIEKSGLVFHKDEWQTRPWKMTGHVKGAGTVKYKFSKTSAAHDQLTYELSMDVKAPHDVELDWSQVTGGIIEFVERNILVGRIKELSIPVRHEGQIDLFEKEAPTWGDLKISSLAVKDAPNGATQIDFVAEAVIGRH